MHNFVPNLARQTTAPNSNKFKDWRKKHKGKDNSMTKKTKPQIPVSTNRTMEVLVLVSIVTLKA